MSSSGACLHLTSGKWSKISRCVKLHGALATTAPDWTSSAFPATSETAATENQCVGTVSSEFRLQDCGLHVLHSCGATGTVNGVACDNINWTRFRLRLGVKLAMAVQMSQQFTSAQGLQGQSVERGAGPRSNQHGASMSMCGDDIRRSGTCVRQGRGGWRATRTAPILFNAQAQAINIYHQYPLSGSMDINRLRIVIARFGRRVCSLC